jgi:hypothetical protein
VITKEKAEADEEASIIAKQKSLKVAALDQSL